MKFLLLILSICCSCKLLTAQQRANPFDLTPRLSNSQRIDSGVAAGSSNPFDVVTPRAGETSPKAKAKVSVKASNPKSKISGTAAYRRFLFISVMSTLLLLTLLMTFLRPFYQKAYSAFGSDNMFNQVLRERDSSGALPFLILYAFFFLNTGLFAYLTLHHYKINLPAGHLLNWCYCTGALLLAFVSKHTLVAFVGMVFPIQKEARMYNFLIIIFCIIIGLILAPINFLMAFGPENISSTLIYLTVGTLGLIYAFRCLRGLIIANRFIAFHKFHFLLYICTVEIAPVLFLVKFVLNQI